jgi:hypothetical protein
MYHLPYMLVWVKNWYFVYNCLINYNFQSNQQMFNMIRIFLHIGLQFLNHKKSLFTQKF